MSDPMSATKTRPLMKPRQPTPESRQLQVIRRVIAKSPALGFGGPRLLLAVSRPVWTAAVRCTARSTREAFREPMNDSTIMRAALSGLGRTHRDAPPPCITGSQMYDLADAWGSLSNERRGEAILVCLAQQSEVEDPGAPPAWMEEYERKDGVF